MKTYIVLLRGINVSGKNELPMAELRQLLNDLGFQNVQTYIQSGNIILSSEESKSEVCQKIKEGILQKFGYDIPVLAKTVDEWKNVIDNYPFSIENPKIVGFVFFNEAPRETVFEINGMKDDQYKINNNVVYIYCPSGFGKTKLTNNLFEQKLKVTATTRNFKTTIKLLEMATN